MLEYKEQADGSLTFNGMTIPAVDGNRHYTEFLLLEEAGEAVLVKWEGSAEQLAADEAEAVAAWKSSRATAVQSITVEVDGMVFDGDETSQTRMARAVTAADNDTDTTIWVLANNDPATVTAAQLKQALRLAGDAQTALWLQT